MKKEVNSVAVWSIFGLGVAFIILYFFINKSSKEHISDWMATSPVHSLYTAQKAVNHDQMDKADEALDKAISELQSIEMYSNPTVNKYIELTIEDLITLQGEMINDNLKVEDMNLVFFEALNAIAYADLSISERDLELRNDYKAIYLLKSSLLILKRSLLYTNDSIKNIENEIIKELNGVLDSLTHSPDFKFFDFTEINNEIEEVLEQSHLD